VHTLPDLLVDEHLLLVKPRDPFGITGWI